MSNKSKSASVATRILKYLKTGADITENQAKSRFGITNVGPNVGASSGGFSDLPE